MRTVEEHQRIVTDLITARPAVSVELREAEGRVLAEDVTAGVSLPVFDNSAMDGYAVRADEVATASPDRPVKLPVAEDIPAGRIDLPALEPGTAHRIMTGAPVPFGATAVVPVESTDGRADVVGVNVSVPEGKHIRRAGEDVASGTVVLRAGPLVTPAVIGLAAALGLPELSVIPPQCVLLVSTGSELVMPGDVLLPGQIYESNSPMLAAALREAGADVVAIATVSDDVDEFVAVLDRYAVDSDLIISSGGISAGAYEVVKDAFGRSGDRGVEFAKVAMQPGMPQGAGHVAGTPILTLPGNPVSALVCFEVFIRGPLRAAMGLPTPDRPRRSVVLAESLTSPRGKRQFRRGVFDAATGTVVSEGPPGSHHLRSLAASNCLVDVPAEVTEIPAGAAVQIWYLG
jgi:molybdopterin molybdotransferase